MRTPVYFLFVDLTKAYDTVPRGRLWQVLIDYFPGDLDLVRAIQIMYAGLQVRLAEDNSLPEIDVNIGLK